MVLVSGAGWQSRKIGVLWNVPAAEMWVRRCAVGSGVRQRAGWGHVVLRRDDVTLAIRMESETIGILLTMGMLRSPSYMGIIPE